MIMTLRDMMVHSIVEFEMVCGNVLTPDMFENVSDKELMKLFRNNVWDESYMGGHIDGYFKGIDYERKINKQIDSRSRLN